MKPLRIIAVAAVLLVLTAAGPAGAAVNHVTSASTVNSVPLKNRVPPNSAQSTAGSFTIGGVTVHTGLGNVVCDYGVGGNVTPIQGAITNPDSTGAGGSIAFDNDAAAYLAD